jgi:hypothetical protein
MNVFTQLFRSSLVAENGEEIAFVWIGDDEHAVYMNPNSAKVYATLWHDGYCKYYPTIYVSVPSAIRILLQREAFGLGLRCFPRCALDVCRLKCFSMAEAQECLQELLTDLRLI